MTEKKDEQEAQTEAIEAQPEPAEEVEMKAAAEAAKAAKEAAAAAEEVTAPAPPAAEEATPASTQEATPTATESARPELPEVLSWAGHKLDEMQGAAVGRVDGAYVDEASRQPEWLLVRMGRFGHHTLVPGRYAVAAAGRVWVPFGRDVIRRAPRVKAGAPLTKDEELALLAHYGVAAPTGRSADIAEREAGAVTARPAS